MNTKSVPISYLHTVTQEDLMPSVRDEELADDNYAPENILETTESDSVVE